jgi:hypothetical protein
MSDPETLETPTQADLPPELALSELLTDARPKSVGEKSALGVDDGLIIADIAGRDSFAALILFLDSLGSRPVSVLPIQVRVPMESGSPCEVAIAAKSVLQKISRHFPQTIMALQVLKAEELWAAAWGRYQGILARKFGITSPCCACHVCIHLSRALTARSLGAKSVVSGERLRHETVMKINQVDIALDTHRAIMDSCGVVHVQPLRYLARQSEICDILNLAGIDPADVCHYRCVFSGSYRDISGEIMPENEAIKKLYADYLLPFAEKVAESVREERMEFTENNLLDIAKDILD